MEGARGSVGRWAGCEAQAGVPRGCVAPSLSFLPDDRTQTPPASQAAAGTQLTAAEVILVQGDRALGQARCRGQGRRQLPWNVQRGGASA